MAIVVSGTNIPNDGNYIKVGNTNVTKVVCNGVTVWEKVTDKTVTGPDLGWVFTTNNGTSWTGEAGTASVSTQNGATGIYTSTNRTDGNWHTPYIRNTSLITCSGFKKAIITVYNTLNIGVRSDGDENGWFNIKIGVKKNTLFTHETENEDTVGNPGVGTFSYEVNITGWTGVGLCIGVSCKKPNTISSGFCGIKSVVLKK